MNGKLFKGEKYAYIIVDYKMDDRNTLENEYTRIVMKIRDAFKFQERGLTPHSLEGIRF